MMKFFEKIDCVVLSLFQGFSDMCQKWIGINNFTLARVCLVLYLVLTVSSMAMNQQVFVLGCLSLIVAILLWFYIKIIEKRIRSTGDSLLKNPLEIEFKVFRLAILVTLLILSIARLLPPDLSNSSVEELVKSEKKTLSSELRKLYDTALFFKDMMYISVLYFISCTSKPPSKSKLRTLVERAGKVMKRIFSPDPSPKPVFVPA